MVEERIARACHVRIKAFSKNKDSFAALLWKMGTSDILDVALLLSLCMSPHRRDDFIFSLSYELVNAHEEMVEIHFHSVIH